jgi:hypothetical protein
MEGRAGRKGWKEGKEWNGLWAHQSTPTKKGLSIFSGFAYGFA